MEEKTTADPIVTGQQRPHLALRRLARACIALVRWRCEQSPIVPKNERPQPTEDDRG